MNQITICDFNFFDKISEMIKTSKITYQEKEYIEFEPVLIKISDMKIMESISPFFDKNKDFLYYRKVMAELDHLLYKWRFKWITSRRQLIQLSEDCFSVIQLVILDDGKLILNCYQRSCNIDTSIKTDIAFLCYWMIENLTKYNSLEINIFNMIPHTWGDKRSKVEQR